MPNCEAVLMSEKTLLSNELKEDLFLCALLKCIAPRQLPITTSEYLEDGKIIFYKPNLKMQLILDEVKKLAAKPTESRGE